MHVKKGTLFVEILIKCLFRILNNYLYGVI